MMERMVSAIRDFVRDDEGLTMVEYAVAGTMITLGAVIAFGDLGTAVETAISNIEGEITAGQPAAAQ